MDCAHGGRCDNVIGGAAGVLYKVKAQEPHMVSAIDRPFAKPGLYQSVLHCRLMLAGLSCHVSFPFQFKVNQP